MSGPTRNNGTGQRRPGGDRARVPRPLRGIAAAALASSLLGACVGAPAPTEPTGARTSAGPVPSAAVARGPFTTASTIADVVGHPAFGDAGELVLPLDGRSWTEEMPLDRVASLLPYHSGVEPEPVVETLNDLVDRLADGRVEVLPVYGSDAVRAQPAKARTALFFFRGDPGAPFAVIAPGGGFSYVGSVHEGFPHAAELSDRGVNAFVLVYRVGGERVACEDLAAALGVVAEDADRLGVALGGYSLWGSSAGARMAARVGSSGPQAYGGPAMDRPAAVITAYTGHAERSADDPPTFAVVGSRDGIAPPAVMQRRVDDLVRLGVPAELRVFPDVGHGFGLGAGTSAEGWVDEAIAFWRAHA